MPRPSSRTPSRPSTAPWPTAQMDQITTEVSRVAGCATLLREHLPRTAQDTVPELTEPADPLHEHLAALARAARRDGGSGA